MKKNLLFGFAVLTIAAVATFTMNVNSNHYGLSNISLANIEALSQRESGGAHSDCYSDIEHTGNEKDKVKSCDAPGYSCSTYVSWYKATSTWLCH